ncbi:MAG TPA: trigger factor [Balneolales bacterium]|nr:trigger factor [Balneolales bacterium]
MDISVEEVSTVDKEITIKADNKDLDPKFDKALRQYRKSINMPGFRPGQVPLSIVKKRYGKEIEMEEIQNYVSEVFRDEIVPKHNPIGEPKFEDLKWEDGQLEVKIKIGTKPEFDLVDVESVEVDQMVHDVTDKEVDEEIERQLEQKGEWSEKETAAGKEDKVVVDAVALDKDGKPKESDKDEDQELDLRDEKNKEFADALKGKKAGDTTTVELGDDDEKEKFELTVKKVLELNVPELNDELAQELSNKEAKTIDEYKGLIKSRIQQYYDQTAQNMAKNEIADKLVEAHDFEVPELLVGQIQNNYVQQVKKQYGDNIPADFDEEEYKNNMKDRAVKDAKWFFISDKFQEKYEIEIDAEDIDAHLAEEAARYGLSVDMMKQFYASSNEQLEQLRMNIRDEKLFDKLLEEVKVNELSKEAYQDKHQEKE